MNELRSMIGILVSEHANNTEYYPLWDEVNLIDRNLHWYSRRVKEAIHPNKIKRDSGIEIPEVWMPTIRQHSIRSLPQQTAEGTLSFSNKANDALDRNPPTMSRGS